VEEVVLDEETSTETSAENEPNSNAEGAQAEDAIDEELETMAVCLTF